MDTREVKANLNAVVQYNGIDYMFQGCTIRKNAATNEFYYQAELADLQTYFIKNPHRIFISVGKIFTL